MDRGKWRGNEIKGIGVNGIGEEIRMWMKINVGEEENGREKMRILGWILNKEGFEVEENGEVEVEDGEDKFWIRVKLVKGNELRIEGKIMERIMDEEEEVVEVIEIGRGIMGREGKWIEEIKVEGLVDIRKKWVEMFNMDRCMGEWRERNWNSEKRRWEDRF